MEDYELAALGFDDSSEELVFRRLIIRNKSRYGDLSNSSMPWMPRLLQRRGARRKSKNNNQGGKSEEAVCLDVFAQITQYQPLCYIRTNLCGR